MMMKLKSILEAFKAGLKNLSLNIMRKEEPKKKPSESVKPQSKTSKGSTKKTKGLKKPSLKVKGR